MKTEKEAEREVVLAAYTFVNSDGDDNTFEMLQRSVAGWKEIYVGTSDK